MTAGRRLIAAALTCLLAGSSVAPSMADTAGTVVAQAAQASTELQAAIVALGEAENARDRVAALSQTIQAYERGLSALREGLRQAAIREAALRLRFEAKRDRLAQLVGVLASMETDPGPLLLLHPLGPLGTARSGMLLAEVTPALQAEAETLRAELQEVQDLRQLQGGAGETLGAGLKAAQEARTALSQAISERTNLPRRFTEDPDALRVLLQSADTLDAFAAGLVSLPDTAGGILDFAAAKGRLPLPVLGTVLRQFQEADAAGIRRPGFLLATRPNALVTTPWPSTIRYRGPLLDYGNVMILEPGAGYLLVLAGLDTVYGAVGQVLGAGAPVGLMGGKDTGAAEFVVAAQEGGGAEATETLYMELRLGGEPVNLEGWFAQTRE